MKNKNKIRVSLIQRATILFQIYNLAFLCVKSQTFDNYIGTPRKKCDIVEQNNQ